ncbi:MAG: methylmalonyl-CoA mutase family protein [Granulosicoccus sp.]
MTSTADNPESTVSLDSLFTPPSRDQWIEMAMAGLRGEKSDMDALQQLRRTTLEGIPLEVLYDSADVPINSPFSDKSANGLDNRLCVKADDPIQASRNILQGLQGGITSIELRTCKPADIPTVLSGVQLNLATVSLRALDQYEVCLQALLELVSAQGHDRSTWYCCVNADPISVALASGANETELRKQLKNVARFTKNTSSSLPSVKCLLVDVALHHNAGASTVEELHAALATATLYLESLLDAGISLEDACEQIVFQIAMDADVLLGVAKLRALKALWQIVVDQFSSGSTKHKPATIVAETSQRFLSILQPWNNHLRNLCASTAALLGGADTLMVHPHDALQRSDKNPDTTLGDRMARNMAIILERECGLDNVHDPMSGSYAIESLTHQLMQYTWQSLASTDTGEGWINELLSERWQTRLTNTHNQRTTLMQREQRIAVGVNRFIQTDEKVHTLIHPTSTTSSHALTAVRDADAFEQSAVQEASS